MKPSSCYDRLVDVMEELVKFTLLVRDRSGYFTSRYSERREADAAAAALAHEAQEAQEAKDADLEQAAGLDRDHTGRHHLPTSQHKDDQHARLSDLLPLPAGCPMTRLTMVVAIDAQRGIGVHNQLPWHLPEDLAHFKRVTLGHPIIMGRKTFDSIGRALPGRRNIVVTRNGGWRHEGVEAVASLEAAVALVGDEEASIIGGAQIFEAALGLADRMIVTEIDHSFACDTFFPPIDPSLWAEAERERHRSEANGYAYAFVTYVRRG